MIIATNIVIILTLILIRELVVSYKMHGNGAESVM